VNVLHFRFQGGAATPTASDITALHAKVERCYKGTAYGAGAAVSVAMPNSSGFTDVTYTPLDGSGISRVYSIAGAAANSNLTLPAEVTWVLTLRTDVRGRRYRGRLYLPTFTTAHLAAGGVLASSTATATVTQFEGFRTDLTAINFAWVVASYGKSPKAAWTPFATDITAVTMNPVADVQRRRKA